VAPPALAPHAHSVNDGPVITTLLVEPPEPTVTV
jgi:hypothetical protein